MKRLSMVFTDPGAGRLSQRINPNCPLDPDSQPSLSGTSCFVKAEREASSAETDDQDKKIRGAEHELSASEQTLSGSLRNVKRISVAAFNACSAHVLLDSDIYAFGGCAFLALSAKCPVFDSSLLCSIVPGIGGWLMVLLGWLKH